MTLLMFVGHGGHWTPDPPDIDDAVDAVDAMVAVAARQVDEFWFAQWLRERVRFSDHSPD